MRDGKLDKPALDRSARKLSLFLVENRDTCILDFPWASLYPENCCQSASLLLLYLFEEKYGLRGGELVKGFTYSFSESHFWVRIEDLAYDLTAGQFPNLAPAIGVPECLHLRDKFPEREVDLERTFLDKHQLLGLYRAGKIPF